MSRAREVGSILVMLGFAAFTVATSKPKKKDAGSDPVTIAPPTPKPFVPSAPLDIDALALATSLGCGAKPTNVACKLLKEFDTAETWVELPVIETVWFGETHALGGVADGKKEFFFMQGGSGIGGFFGAARTLLPDNAKEVADAQKLLVATKAGRTVPGSEALKFMRTAAPPVGRRLIVKTSGRSQALTQSPTQVYVRGRGERLLIVEHTGAPLGHDSNKGAGPALAWVAEIFRLR